MKKIKGKKLNSKDINNIECMFKDGNRKMFNFMKFIGVIIVAAAIAVALLLASPFSGF